MGSNKISDIEELSKTVLQFRKSTNKIVIIYDKKKKRKNRYKAYRLNANPKTINNIIEQMLKKLEEEFCKRKIDDYDLELATDESIQVVEKNLVMESNKLEKYITLKEDITPTLEKCENFKFNFVAIKLLLGEGEVKQELTIYRKYNNFSANFPKAFKLHFVGGEIKELSSDILCLDSLVDAFEYNGYFYVLNRNSFNNIFEFKDVYEKIINSNKDILIKSQIIENSEQFITDCKEDGRFIKRLAKVMLANDFKEIICNKNKIKKLKVERKLNIELDKKNRIVYKDKTQAGTILNILLDHYVKSLLTNRVMLVKAIEKYNIGGD